MKTAANYTVSVGTSLMLFWSLGCRESTSTRTPALDTPPSRMDRGKDRQLVFRIVEHTEGRLGVSAPTNQFTELAVWSDGRVQWGHRTNDGVSTKTAALGVSKCLEFVAKLKRVGFFDEAKVDRRTWFGPDHGYIAIEGFLDGQPHYLKSWHEQFERNTNLVVVDGWVEPLDGRARDAAVGKSSPDYKRFRRLWSDVRSLATDLANEAERDYDARH
jgi:hypothetical protein